MKTTVMFINQSQPLAGVPVRLVAVPHDLHITDEEGKIEVELGSGTHTFEIQLEDGWVSRTVEREGESPMFVINVARDPHISVSGLNTLQVDLANVVGDRFVFETVLGRGGMGVVVKAVDRMLNRPVAIKMLSEELQDNEEAQQIFLVEARNLATLSHPNLVAIHDILNVDGRVLMVFEYVLGENIETRLKEKGRVDMLMALRIGIQLTRCVAYLHEHDLIHRDLKPSNVIVQSDGTVKLIDFGLARSLSDLYIRGTRVRGTPAYMAPEQVQGIHLTVATDIYQLGITLFEMLTGELPFPTGDMAYAHVHKEPPRIQDKAPGIPRPLAVLVGECLAKSPKERPPTAQALLERLQSIYSRLSSDHPSNPSFDTGDFGLPEVPSSIDAEQSFVEIEDFDFDSPVANRSRLPLLIGTIAVAVIAVSIVAVFQMSSSTPDAATTQEAVERGSETSSEDVEPVPTAGLDPPLQDAGEIAALTDAIGAAQNIAMLGLQGANISAREQAAPAAVVQNEPAARKPTKRRADDAPVRRAAPQPTSQPDEPPSATETNTAAATDPSEKRREEVQILDDNEKDALLPVEEHPEGGLLPVD